MKQAVNFRLEGATIVKIRTLAREFQVTKTELVERAILFFGEEMSGRRSQILRHAGVLSDDEAEGMLKNIRESRQGKDLEIDL